MRSGVLACLAVVLLLVVAAAPLVGHHSRAAQFDRNEEVTLTGPVTDVEWLNPHVYVFIDVQDEATGEVAKWGFEGGTPNILLRQGWRRDTIKIGDIVTISGSPAKDGSRIATAGTVTHNGRVLFRDRFED